MAMLVGLDAPVLLAKRQGVLRCLDPPSTTALLSTDSVSLEGAHYLTKHAAQVGFLNATLGTTIALFCAPHLRVIRFRMCTATIAICSASHCGTFGRALFVAPASRMVFGRFLDLPLLQLESMLKHAIDRPEVWKALCCEKRTVAGFAHAQIHMAHMRDTIARREYVLECIDSCDIRETCLVETIRWFQQFKTLS